MREILEKGLTSAVASELMNNCPVSLLGHIEELCLWSVRSNNMHLFLYLVVCENAHYLDDIPPEEVADALEQDPSVMSQFLKLSVLRNCGSTILPAEMVSAVVRRGLIMTYFHNVLDTWGFDKKILCLNFFSFDDVVAAISLFPSSDELMNQFRDQTLVDFAVVAYSLLGQPIRGCKLTQKRLNSNILCVLPPAVACNVEIASNQAFTKLQVCAHRSKSDRNSARKSTCANQYAPSYSAIDLRLC